MDGPTVFETPTGLGVAAYVGAFFAVLFVAGLVLAWLRCRSIQRSVELKTIMAIACHLAFDRRQTEVHAAHLGLALTLDPNGRRALAAMGVDTTQLRRLYESRVAELPSAVEDYRATQPLNLASHASSMTLVRHVMKQPVISTRSWLLSMLVDREVGSVARRCGATVVAANRLPEADVARAGDLVVEGAPTKPEELRAVSDLLGEVFALDTVEAKATTIAMSCRGSVRFANGSAALAEQLARAARDKSAPVTARYLAS